MKELVSVIIPTYNRREMLKIAINSVLAQTYTHFELLICDDGSCDGSKEMVECINDSRVHWIDGENSGRPAVPRNRGIKSAKGEWIAFLDSDDYWVERKLEIQIEEAKKQSVDAVCTNASLIRGNKLLKDLYFKTGTERLLSFKSIKNTNPIICSSMMLRSSVVKLAGNFPEDIKYKAIEDYALWFSASMLTDILYLAQPLTVYRDEPEESIRGEVSDSELHQHMKVVRHAIWRKGFFTNISVRLKKELLYFYIRRELSLFFNKNQNR